MDKINFIQIRLKNMLNKKANLNDTLTSFIEMVDKEAYVEAKKVYNKYQSKFIALIKSGMGKGDTYFIGMGSGSITKRNGETVSGQDSDFVQTVNMLQYKDLEVGFDLPEEIIK